ncbi:hypothetical protein SB775_25710 [Peribacillus sp. SIMBA_075]|uniref:hypothetical protein n=1 Tax=Peribacillus sp. SIMBA_075 TaxID=3085813 RepID=UPI00397C57C2
MLLISLCVVALGILFIYIGFIMKKKGTTTFIAGYNNTFFPKNEAKLANWIGLIIIIFGIVTILFPIAFQIFDGLEGYHFAIIAIGHIIAVFIAILLDQLSNH